MTAHVIPPPPQGGPDEAATGLRAFHPVGQHAMGWCYDPEDPTRRFVIDVRVDGESMSLVLAETFIPTLRDRFGGDGCHGFLVRLDRSRLAGAVLVEAYVANTDVRLGAFRLDEAIEPAAGTGRIVGEMQWMGGLRITGWACDVAAPVLPLTIDILVDGDPITQVTPHRWREAGPNEAAPSGRFAFDACLPARFADGIVHTIRCLAGGTELAGSPCVVLAHGQGFEGLAAEIDPDGTTGHLLRARLLDRLMPSSIPMGEFDAWRVHFPVPAPRETDLVVGVAVIGDIDGDVSSTLVSLGAQSHPHWVAVSIAASDGAFTAEAFAAAAAELADAGAEVVVVLEAGSLLDPHAFGHLAAAFEDARYPGLVYSDSVVRMRDGRMLPSFKPSFDRHRMLAQPYAADLFAVSRRVLDQLRHDPPVSLWNLLFKSARAAGSIGEKIAHLPELLVTVTEKASAARATHLLAAAREEAEARGRPAVVEPLQSASRPAVSLAWPAEARASRVSVIIPTRDRLDLLQPCIETMLQHTQGVAYEVIVVDNGSREPATLSFLQALSEAGGTVVRADFPFNYARLNNLAVARASNELVCFLNNDVEIIDGAWLREMALELADPAVAVVGATLLWPSRIVQHGGVVLGPHFAAAHAFNDRIDGEGGYDDQLLVPRRQSAVTAACMLMRRSDYLALGGMDEDAFPVAFNDVDLCLKAGAAGGEVLITPRARLLHKESASRGLDHLSHEKRSRARKELEELRRRWGHVLADDPFYHPSLCLDLYPFSGLAAPPRGRDLRILPEAGA